MAKRPRSPEQEDPIKAKRGREGAEPKAGGLGRREFVKLVGGASAAVSAGVLKGFDLLGAPAPAAVKILGPGTVKIGLRVNSEMKSTAIEPRFTLLDVLRDQLNLTGAKKVCDRGTCGACMVIVNGKAIYSCTVLAIDVSDAVANSPADIRTIEGLAPEGELHAVSAAFVDNDAQQCSSATVCVPSGKLMIIKSEMKNG